MELRHLLNLLLLADTLVSSSLDCYFSRRTYSASFLPSSSFSSSSFLQSSPPSSPSSTSTSPDLLTCFCDHGQGTFQWDTVERMEHVQLSTLKDINFINCSSLHLLLTKTIPTPLPRLSVSNMAEVEMVLAQVQEGPNMVLTNVSRVTIVRQQDEWQNRTSYHMFLVIVGPLVGGLILVTLIGYYILIIRRRDTKDEDGKKVSRAVSWRYESSVMVNQPGRLQKINQSMGYVPPPPPPAEVESTTSTSSSRAGPRLQEVDLVQTSQPAPSTSSSLFSLGDSLDPEYKEVYRQNTGQEWESHRKSADRRHDV